MTSPENPSREQIETFLNDRWPRLVVLRPAFVEVFGGINEALIIQDLLYWSDKGDREDGFIYKSQNELTNETGLTIRQQNGARKKLNSFAGLIVTERHPIRGAPTLHYKLDLGILLKAILDHYKLSDSTMSKVTTDVTKEKALSPYGEKPPSFRRRRPRDERVLRVVEKFREMVRKHLGREILIGEIEYAQVKRALNGILTEEQIYDLFECWFALGKPDNETVHLRKALSNYQITNYKVDNNIH